MDDLLLTSKDVEALLARRLRTARKRRRWTQAELAERSGVSVATVTRFERSGTGQLANLLRLCAALGHLRDFEAVLRLPEPRTLEELRSRL